MEFELILVLLIVVNIIGYMIMKADKKRAKKKQYRISEKTLWLIALAGGAAGMTMGMQKFRHKTKHLSFKLGLPFVMVCQFLVVFLYVFNSY